MFPRHPIRVAIILTVIVAPSVSGVPLRAEDFDKPLRMIDVNLGKSRYLMPRSSSRILLSCYYYPGFMVKELNDPGLKGTRWVTITPAAQWRCIRLPARAWFYGSICSKRVVGVPGSEKVGSYFWKQQMAKTTVCLSGF